MCLCGLYKMLDMGDKVVNKSQVKKALKIKGPIGTATASIAMAITGLNRINRIFSHISAYRGIEFADNLIKYLNVTRAYPERGSFYNSLQPSLRSDRRNHNIEHDRKGQARYQDSHQLPSLIYSEPRGVVFSGKSVYGQERIEKQCKRA